MLSKETTEIGSFHTVGELLDRYALEVSPIKKGTRWEKFRLNRMRQYRLAEISLDTIT